MSNVVDNLMAIPPSQGCVSKAYIDQHSGFLHWAPAVETSNDLPIKSPLDTAVWSRENETLYVYVLHPFVRVLNKLALLPYEMKESLNGMIANNVSFTGTWVIGSSVGAQTHQVNGI